jgi:hypothetical protein
MAMAETLRFGSASRVRRKRLRDDGWGSFENT